MSNSPKKIAGVILAAGTSTRMGKTKQLLPFKNTTILGQVINNARASKLDEIIVVTGHDQERILQTIDFTNITIATNHNYKKGQSSSLIKGMEKISSQSDAAMFLLADQPLVTHSIIDLMINAFTNSPKSIAIPYCNNMRGNPVIIARPFFPHIKALSGDTGARDLFNQFRESILKITIPDKAILMDIDTKDDYEKLISEKS